MPDRPEAPPSPLPDYARLPHATDSAANDAAQVLETHAFHFTGSGKEYFRIWIVNLCLTVATLGIYSAWAKVRRLQYFDRNTQLDGAVFDFHGDPMAILKGRLIAMVLLVTYHYAFGFSKEVGIAVVCLLLFGGPFMMRNALRFRSRNTSYRGLRFNFCGSTSGAYLTYLPVILLFVLPGALLALQQVKASAMVGLLYLAWPLMHAAMKRYQHRHLEYGVQQASFELPMRRFWRPYLLAILFGVLALVAVSVLAGVGSVIIAAIAKKAGGTPQGGYHAGVALGIVLVIVVMYLAYLVAGPYIQVRINNMVWSNTRFAGVELRSEMKVGSFIALQSVNVILTLFTLGLFRPFAAVRTHRYRLAHMSVHTSDASFEHLLAGTAAQAVGAGGDGAADFLDFDLSW